MKYSITKLTVNSSKNLNFIFNNYKELIKPNIKNTYFIKLLYTIIDKSVNKNTPHSLIKMVNTKVDKLLDKTFISKEIINYIDETTFINYNVSLKIKNATYNIFIYSKKEININKYIYFIKLILNICAYEASTHNNIFTIKIILTDFKKTQPTIPINPDSINSGVTSYPLHETKNDNKEIIIFRKEEWFKVLIHECFHMFCLDFSNVNNISYSKLFKDLYNINSEFLFFESLCEFWARTINIAIISYSSKKNILYDDFESLMQINIKLETIYSLLQMNYILNNMGFTYNSLMDKNRILEYNENTNLFCYYVLTPLLLFHYEQTMAWFIDNNQTILQFSKNKKNILLFFYYIKSIYNNPKLLNTITNLKEYNLKNNYMTLFEIFI
jgi:hypothetical protein